MSKPEGMAGEVSSTTAAGASDGESSGDECCGVSRSVSSALASLLASERFDAFRDDVGRFMSLSVSDEADPDSRGGRSYSSPDGALDIG